MVRKLLSPEQSARQFTRSVVYVSRNDSASRRVSNEDSLLDALQIDGRTRGYGLVVVMVNCGPNSMWRREEDNDPSQNFATGVLCTGVLCMAMVKVYLSLAFRISYTACPLL